jgi:hypothetical protein
MPLEPPPVEEAGAVVEVLVPDPPAVGALAPLPDAPLVDAVVVEPDPPLAGALAVVLVPGAEALGPLPPSLAQAHANGKARLATASVVRDLLIV